MQNRQTRPRTQDLEQRRGEHHVAILLPLALLDAEDHLLAVDRGNRQVHGFRDAQTRRAASRENHPLLGKRDALEVGMGSPLVSNSNTVKDQRRDPACL